MSKSPRIVPEVSPEEVFQSECENPAKFLGWETGEIRSLEHALKLCEEVDICQRKCGCKLRDAYHFYLIEENKEYR